MCIRDRIPNVPQSQKCSNYRAPRAGYEGWGVASRAPRASLKGALPIQHLELFLRVSHLEHLGLVPVLKKGLKNWYYSLKIFPRFWLAKSTRIIHHNQLLMTKFGRILCLTRKWGQKCSLLQVNAPLTEKTWGRGWVVLDVKKKNGRHFTRFKSKNYSWN